MRVQIKSTSVLSAWLPMVEQACADTVDQHRKDAFFRACSAEGLPATHRIVRTLAEDLTRIRPPDVWLRIIASHLTQAQRDLFPLTALDHGLSTLRLADAYVRRSNADVEVSACLLDAVARQMPYPAVERWYDWHSQRAHILAPDDEDVLSICSDAGRYAPLSMVTKVCSHYGDWSARFTTLVENLGALEYCGSEIVAWRRGNRGDPRLSGRWLQTHPTTEEHSIIEAALNMFAENVYVKWSSTRICISPEWLPLLDETISAAIQFAVSAVEMANGSN